MLPSSLPAPELALILTFPSPTPKEITVESISSLWNHPWLFASGPLPFVHGTFVHSTSVHATFVYATYDQGHLVVYTYSLSRGIEYLSCYYSSLDKTIKFQTSYRAKQKIDQLQLILSLAQLSPSLLSYYYSLEWGRGVSILPSSTTTSP